MVSPPSREKNLRACCFLSLVLLSSYSQCLQSGWHIVDTQIMFAKSVQKETLRESFKAIWKNGLSAWQVVPWKKEELPNKTLDPPRTVLWGWSLLEALDDTECSGVRVWKNFMLRQESSTAKSRETEAFKIRVEKNIIWRYRVVFTENSNGQQ